MSEHVESVKRIGAFFREQAKDGAGPWTEKFKTYSEWLGLRDPRTQELNLGGNPNGNVCRSGSLSWPHLQTSRFKHLNEMIRGRFDALQRLATKMLRDQNIFHHGTAKSIRQFGYFRCRRDDVVFNTLSDPHAVFPECDRINSEVIHHRFSPPPPSMRVEISPATTLWWRRSCVPNRKARASGQRTAMAGVRQSVRQVDFAA